MSDPSTRQLIDDLRAVVGDAEALLQATAHDAGERAQAARERATHSVDQARERLAQLEQDLGAEARALADGAGRWVREHPLQSLGIAAAVGLVVGVLINRRGE
jgi:ElaB/YqjD/DUF883 family membrane-anchored ribosome-binding protein